MEEEINKLFADAIKASDDEMVDIETRLEQIRKKRNQKVSDEDYPQHFDGTCPICFESEPNNWCILPCKHVFHCSCIKDWYYHRLMGHFDPKCPKCNKGFNSSQIIPKKLYLTEGPGADQLDFGNVSEIKYLKKLI